MCTGMQYAQQGDLIDRKESVNHGSKLYSSNGRVATFTVDLFISSTFQSTIIFRATENAYYVQHKQSVCFGELP